MPRTKSSYRTFYQVVFVDEGPDPTVYPSDLIFPEAKATTARDAVALWRSEHASESGLVPRLARLRLRGDNEGHVRIMRTARAHTRGEQSPRSYAFDLLAGEFTARRSKEATQ